MMPRFLSPPKPSFACLRNAPLESRLTYPSYPLDANAMAIRRTYVDDAAVVVALSRRINAAL
jgi:hypothetical protein